MANEIAIRILTAPARRSWPRSAATSCSSSWRGWPSCLESCRASSRTTGITAEDIRAARRPPPHMRSDLGLVVLENTHNSPGARWPTPAMRGAIAAAHDAGVPVHVDGARLWNASVVLGAPGLPGGGADSAMVTLSKGLRAPRVGPRLVARPHRGRPPRPQAARGGMRQVGILARRAVGVESMVDRLAEDHVNAALLTEALAVCPGVRVRPPERTSWWRSSRSDPLPILADLAAAAFSSP